MVRFTSPFIRCLTLTLALAAALPALAREPNFAPKSCAAGKLARYPKNLREGVRAHYVFEYDFDRVLAKYTRQSDAVLADYVRHRTKAEASLKMLAALIGQDRRYYLIRTYEQGFRIFLETRDRLHAPQELDQDLMRLCAIFTAEGFDITDLQVRTDIEEYDFQRRENLASRNTGHAFLWEIDQEKVESFLREHWESLRHDFFDVPTNFSRIRRNDFGCQYVDEKDAYDDHVSCAIGVLAMSAAGPEYAQKTIDFVRNHDPADGPMYALKIWTPDPGFIMVN